MALPEEFDQEKLAEIGLALLCLTARRDRSGARAWKSMDWDVMALMHERGWIGNPVGKAKSVLISEEGIEKAEEFQNKYFGREPS